MLKKEKCRNTKMSPFIEEFKIGFVEGYFHQGSHLLTVAPVVRALNNHFHRTKVS